MFMPHLSELQQLFNSLDQRHRPEDVAKNIMIVLDNSLSGQQRKLLDLAARGAIGRGTWYSSISPDFARPVGMERQLAKAAELFEQTPALPLEARSNPSEVLEYLSVIEQEINKTIGQNRFLQDRKNRAERNDAGLEWSKRQYNKRFRLAARMEKKYQRWTNEIEKRALILIGKSRLASQLSWADFSADQNTACFIAYLVARLNRRSEFTVSSQSRAYDEIAQMLFERCLNANTTHWWALAHVFPDQKVLGFLNDQQKGQLLGNWFGILERVAHLLEQIWQANTFNCQTMIVKRGDDSTNWNVIASAWNKARDGWIALVYALDMDEILDNLCPGKVMRLMAADVAAWHQNVGGGLQIDTFIWNELPFPWEVISGKAVCTRATIKAVCQRFGDDVANSGWLKPREMPRAERFMPTPELVHGVTVGSPFLAAWLRQRGFFSGKHFKNLTNP
jgi:hypothetical protein